MPEIVVNCRNFVKNRQKFVEVLPKIVKNSQKFKIFLNISQICRKNAENCPKFVKNRQNLSKICQKFVEI